MGPRHRLAVILACAGAVGAHDRTIHPVALAAPGVIVFSGGPLRTVVVLSILDGSRHHSAEVNGPQAIVDLLEADLLVDHCVVET